ncbi:transcription-repair coupling factor [Bhargavaea beijingensis]|uniref:Transcription-repair-coupling factor n=1 Tax=Bhargavaea beijingensis TaxID=426756 RepID=A0ABX9Z9V9_9BACL|nr:transcription-repair coupling factor [Bhargavaea beijingensis]RSK24881.1 transcription-repair coupling factor [Bhargavaea beijingensis]
MEELLDVLAGGGEIADLLGDLKEGRDRQLVTGLAGGVRAALFALAAKETGRPILVVEPNMLQAQRTYEDLTRLSGEESVRLYPADELTAAELSVASPELRAQRIEALDHLMRDGSGIFVTPIAGLRKLLPAPPDWKKAALTAQLGDEIDPADWAASLVAMGFSRQPMVTSPGEFALRGGILDIYPLDREEPVRIELFDTEIDSIRTFSADDQRSTGRLETVRILPAHEFTWSAERLAVTAQRLEESLAESLKKVSDEAAREALLENIGADISLMKDGEIPESVMKYASLAGETAFLGDYFPEEGILFYNEAGRIIEVAESLERQEGEWHTEMIASGKLVHDARLSHTFKEIDAMAGQKKVYLSLFSRSLPGLVLKDTIQISCKPMQQFHGQMNLLKSEAERWQAGGFTVLLLAGDRERMEKVRSILEDYGMEAGIPKEGTVPGPGIHVIEGDLSDGFELPLRQIAVVTDSELFKQRSRRKARAQKLSNAERIKSYSEIKPGDYVVHIQHGIGKYIGIETLAVGGTHKDYLHISYRGDDKLYVPIDQIDQIQKYVGSEDREPKIHKLGGTEWKKTKSKVSKAVKDIADDLIKLYAKREAEKGFAFSPDDDLMHAFEASFPYDETDDQLRSIEEIKRDMERERPMDRLLCGDVGYGKTEVAIRAAFKAVGDGKQVAFLVPTTILAQQHFETMKERFAGFPVEVRMLSRFGTRKEHQETVKGLKDGTVDVVVGTHRLLSKDVEYRDLGLLIVDEEQRFGVTHKERIKQMKANVDVLTLTATPIPRTLHMSMIGVRDLSVLETPPANRFPVQTYVMEYSGPLVREAIEREMARGGQVFYLYNRVEDMARKAEEIQMLVPDARIATAHGRMSETELEAVILAFLEGEYDVLVTTTIIETGVDIPNVNTLIVHDADRMGLAQLYQLRGRVGRSNRVAYAYFLYRRNKVLSDVAENRLQAIKEFTELGSGFKIAMRDLSIRGAGNLLGAQQHGFIDSVGFDMYSKMLEEAIEEKRGNGKEEEMPDVEVTLHLDAYFPDSFIPDGFQKIQMYKRVKAVETEEDYSELVDEMADRFGDLPLEAEQLLKIALMKVWARGAGVESIKQQGDRVIISFTEAGTQRADGAKIMEGTLQYGRAVSFHMEGGRLLLTVDGSKTGKNTLFDVLEGVMKILPDAKKQEA